MNGRDRLVVYVRGARAGVLAADATGRHVYAYDADCPPARFVSLTMPVRLESYAWHELHPVFQVNLPDPATVARQEARAARGAPRPIDALATLGDAGLGRVVAVAEGSGGGSAATGTADAGGTDARARALPPALLTVATPDAPHRPFVAWCALRAARRAGFDVPASELAADAAELRVARFDAAADGRLGYEDFCALAGLGAAQRYEGSAESLVSAAAAFSAPVRRTAVRRELFRRLAFAHAIRDADAHRQRFGLLYADAADVRLAPLHAAGSTRVAGGSTDEGPALALGGRRAWRTKPGTWRRFAAHCALSDREALSILQWHAQALHAELTALEAPEGPDAAWLAPPARRELVGALRAEWTLGVEDLQAGW